MAATVKANAGEAISSPPRWNQIVRGADPQPIPSPPPPELPVFVDQSSPEGDASKKPAWKNPYNAAAAAAVDTVVMGAVSWPTLSESTKPSHKSPPLSEPQQQQQPLVATTNADANATAVSPHKQMSCDPNSPNPSAAQHHGRPVRQKSMKREAGGNSSSNGTTNNTPLKVVSDTVYGHGQHNNNVGRDGGGQRSGQQRNFRRSSSGPHLRGGDASFGGRRDQDHDWNHRRSFNGRDPYAPPHRVGASGFITPPPPPPAAAYIPPPMQPYGGPMSIPPEMQPLYYFALHPGMPFVAQMPPAVYYPGPDPQLHVKIMNQIDYYFSNENLVKDTYLRQNMDEQGWVPVQLIANFKKVMQLTTDIQLLLDAIRASTAVEIQGDKIRRRDDWKRWIMPTLVQFPSAAGSQSPHNLQDTLPDRVQGLSLIENTANYSNSNSQDFYAGILLRSSSGDMNGRPEISKE